jgi:hypothetical protein
MNVTGRKDLVRLIRVRLGSSLVDEQYNIISPIHGNHTMMYRSNQPQTDFIDIQLRDLNGKYSLHLVYV